MKTIFSIIYLIVFTSSGSLLSQDFAIFIDGSHYLNNNNISGGPFCGFIDINGDYRDDLIRFSDRDKLYIDIQSNNGEKFENKFISRIDGGSWSLMSGDLNNDGVNEILSAGQYNGATVLSAVNTQSDFSITQETETDFFAQNSNFVDINNDGWLDAFICNDDGINKIFQNNGAGVLIANHNFIDMKTDPVSDNSGNYSSVWTDIDGDDDLDFYIGKCKIGIDDANDPRRINMLFINNNGNYEESAAAFGLAVGAQTWTANFGDIDNDGDQDVFMINHEERSMLFENIDNDTFVEIPLLKDGTTLNTEGYQSSFADFNNDGFLDIIVTGEEDFLLLSNQDNSFISNPVPFGFEDLASFALGDANQDGFVDVFGHYNNIFENDFKPAKLFISLTNENHFITVALKGNTSNANGIGSKVLLYGDWGVQTRVIKSGTGYGITNSLTARFGLGKASQIDSMVIKWPSGQQDVYLNPAINDHYLASEGSCLSPLATARKSEDILDCNTQEITLSVPHSGQSILWSNDDVGSETIIETYDHVFATLTDTIDAHCKTYSQYIIIDTLAALIKPELNIISDFKLCENNLPITISSRFDNELLWQDNSLDQSFNINHNNQIVASVSNRCDTLYSDVIDAFVYDFTNETFDTTIIINEIQPVTLSAKYENDVIWYDHPSSLNILNEGFTFTTDTIRSDTSFFYSASLEQLAPVYIGGESISKSLEAQSLDVQNLNAKMFFKVNEAIIFEGVTVNASIEGKRVFEIFSIEENMIVYQDTFDLAEGINIVNFDILLERNNYELTTNSDNNQIQFGFLGPQLNSLFSNVQYPYDISNLMQIQSSAFGEEIYPYFFDWRAKILIDPCSTELYEVKIDLDTISQLNVLSASYFNIYPNPTEGILNIASDSHIDAITIYDLKGRLLQKHALKSNYKNLDLTSLFTGIYILEIMTAEGVYRKRIIKE